MGGGGGKNPPIESTYKNDHLQKDAISDSLNLSMQNLSQQKSTYIESSQDTPPPHNQFIESNITINTDIPKIPQYLIKFRVNPKAFINAHNFKDLDELVEEVKRVDSDKESFKAMLKEPALIDVNLKEAQQSVIDFIESILTQEPYKAFRRGQGHYLDIHRTHIQKSSNISDLLKYYRLALFIDKILKQRLIVRDGMRHFINIFRSKG